VARGWLVQFQQGMGTPPGWQKSGALLSGATEVDAMSYPHLHPRFLLRPPALGLLSVPLPVCTHQAGVADWVSVLCPQELLSDFQAGFPASKRWWYVEQSPTEREREREREQVCPIGTQGRDTMAEGYLAQERGMSLWLGRPRVLLSLGPPALDPMEESRWLRPG
jgi:hypothetical protein